MTNKPKTGNSYLEAMAIPILSRCKTCRGFGTVSRTVYDRRWRNCTETTTCPDCGGSGRVKGE